MLERLIILFFADLFFFRKLKGAACDLAFDARHSFVEVVVLAGGMEAVVRAWHRTVAWSALAFGGVGAHVERHPSRVPYQFWELHMRPELARETTCELAV